MAKAKRLAQVTVDFAVDLELFDALRKYLATDPELKAPAVVRKALREHLRALGYYQTPSAR